jgi:hypothetical protein
MSVNRRNLGWSACASLGVVSTLALSAGDPPLLPDEVLFKGGDGCGIIQTPAGKDREPDAIAKTKARIAGTKWTGPCVNGLAHGFGNYPKLDAQGKTIGQIRHEYAFGRFMGRSEEPRELKPHDVLVMYSLRGQAGSLRRVLVQKVADPYAPVWGVIDAEPMTFLDGNGEGAMTLKVKCMGRKTAAGENFRDCTATNNYDIYGVAIKGATETSWLTHVSWCPDPRTPAGCEPLWLEKAGPVIGRIKIFIAEAERRDAERKLQLAELTAPWERRRAEDLAAAQQQTARAPEAEADARELADLEFQQSVISSNAGQLFALADKLNAQGQKQKSREVLRALVSRFPNHPLAVTAAGMMMR